MLEKNLQMKLDKGPVEKPTPVTRYAIDMKRRKHLGDRKKFHELVQGNVPFIPNKASNFLSCCLSFHKECQPHGPCPFLTTMVWILDSHNAWSLLSRNMNLTNEVHLSSNGKHILNFYRFNIIIKAFSCSKIAILA
jgi:hypothetical protein